MSKNIIIQEGGVNKTLNGIKKIQTAKSGGGDVLWIPEEEIKTGNKTIKKNGTYYAKTDGLKGYVKVYVNVPGGKSKTDNNGNLLDDDGDTVDEDGNKTKDSGKDPVKPKPSSGGDNDSEGSNPGVVGKDPDDGNEYHIKTDPTTGDLIRTKIPSSIKVTTPPTKTTYHNGDTLILNGIIVHKYFGDGTDAGTILQSELKFDPMTVESYEGISARSDSLVSKAGTLLWTNNGTRSPVTKVNDGRASCLISNNSEYGLAEEEIWIGIIVLSNTPEGCEISVPKSKMVGSGTISGQKVYYQVVGTCQTFGGGTTYTNPQGLPVTNMYFHQVNTLPTQQELEAIANYLELEIGDGESGKCTITVKWARPTDGKVLTDTFNVTVSSGGDIEHDYTGPQE